MHSVPKSTGFCYGLTPAHGQDAQDSARRVCGLLFFLLLPLGLHTLVFSTPVIKKGLLTAAAAEGGAATAVVHQDVVTALKFAALFFFFFFFFFFFEV